MYSKVLVAITLNWTALSWGFMQGHMAGMIGAFQKNEDGIELSEAEISLLGAFLNLFSAPGIIYLAFISEKLGRRWCLIISSLPLLINWIILYFSKTFAFLLLSRFFAGLSGGQLWSMTTIASAEYSSYKSRAVLLSMVGMVVPSLGTGLGHVLGVIFHWRTTSLIGIALSLIHVLMPYFCEESPHWLASKGRFKEAEETFRKLHGKEQSCEHELGLLIKLEAKKQKVAGETNTNSTFRKLIHASKQRYFWNLIIICMVIFIYYTAAGKVLFTNLATVIVEGMTGTSDVLLYTFFIDGFIFIGTCISCFLIKKMAIRALLFSSGLAANFVLMALSAGLYFKNNEVYFQWINVTLLALYFIVSFVGPYPVMDVLLGELFPLELKLYCYVIAMPIILTSMFMSLFLLPYIVSAMGYHGLFLLNSAIIFMCLGYLYVQLPETKGKTLQEIEVYMQTNSFDVNQVLSPNEQTKTLI